jgi:hypothetical protein
MNRRNRLTPWIASRLRGRRRNFAFFAHRRLLPSLRAKQHCRGKTDRHTREGGYPVRRGFSIQSLLSLGYWITRLRG